MFFFYENSLVFPISVPEIYIGYSQFNLWNFLSTYQNPIADLNSGYVRPLRWFLSPVFSFSLMKWNKFNKLYFAIIVLILMNLNGCHTYIGWAFLRQSKKLIGKSSILDNLNWRSPTTLWKRIFNICFMNRKWLFYQLLGQDLFHCSVWK